jgi:hypothetical protein
MINAKIFPIRMKSVLLFGAAIALKFEECRTNPALLITQIELNPQRPTFKDTIESIHFNTPTVIKPGTTISHTFSIGSTIFGKTTTSLCDQTRACESDQYSFDLVLPFNVPPVLEVNVEQTVQNQGIILACIRYQSKFYPNKKFQK